MKCSEFRKNVLDFVEGETTFGMENDMNEHMKNCEECRKIYEEEKEVKEKLDKTFDKKSDYKLQKDAIMSKIDKQKYKNKYRFKKLLYPIAAVIAICIMIPFLTKINFKTATNPITTPSDKNQELQEYFPFTPNVHMVYTSNQTGEEEYYVEYIDSNKMQIREINQTLATTAVYFLNDGQINFLDFNSNNQFRVNKLIDFNSVGNTILRTPLKKGTTWESPKGTKKTITAVDVDVETPSGKYKAIEVTLKLPLTSSALNSKSYYAKGIGLVKQVFMDPSGNTASEKYLKKIEYNKACPYKITAYYPYISSNKVYYNTETKELKTNEDLNIKDELNNLFKQGKGDISPVLDKDTTINDIKSSIGEVTVNLSNKLSTKDEDLENKQLKCLIYTLKKIYNVNKAEVTVDGKTYESKVTNYKLTDFSKLQDMALYEDNDDIAFYTADINTYEKKIDFRLNIPKDYTLNQKLDMVAKKLSENYFGNLPIEVVKIEDTNGKKVAVINLNESKENQDIKDYTKLKGHSFAAEYFQGSTQGIITSTRLIETFLQRDIKEGWVDGVRFTYNNKKIDFDHVPELSATIYK